MINVQYKCGQCNQPFESDPTNMIIDLNDDIVGIGCPYCGTLILFRPDPEDIPERGNE